MESTVVWYASRSLARPLSMMRGSKSGIVTVPCWQQVQARFSLRHWAFCACPTGKEFARVTSGHEFTKG